MKKSASSNQSTTNISFPIVGIGASAGGIEAVTQLLKNLSPNTGMAFVYIQHLDPTHESKLSAILGRATSMEVLEAKDDMRIEPNHVYIIPPNKSLSLVDGALVLDQRKPRPTVHLPIDQFFISLAEVYRESAIGVLLSGNASDGALGLKAIKMAGGITIAQDDSARFKGMPKSAIAEGIVDMVMPPDEIAHELEHLSLKSAVIRSIADMDDDSSDGANEDLASILQLLKKSTGVDFTHYKIKTIKRRIIRRMLLYKLDTLHDYVQYLRQHATEVNMLYQDLLINVTSFFRDPDAMEYLKKSLFPSILKNKAPNDPLRIWVPACSTGEEAYSIAMLFMEILGDKISGIPIQIFATDLSEVAIAKARLGLYTRNDMAEVSPRRLERFFTKVDGSYRIIKSIRDLCIFAPHNIFRDPPFSRIDFISCCNLMIYLDTVLQKKIIATFHYALNNNGYLMLGKSETIGASGRLFVQVEKKYKIYSRKKDAQLNAILEMNYRVTGSDRLQPPGKRTLAVKETTHTPDLEKNVDNLLLSRYVPACVVVNQDLEILQFRGSTGLFLEPSPGKASLNLVKMAKPGLAFELRNAIHKSSRTGESIKKAGLEIKHHNQLHQVSIEVTPMKSDGEEKLFLVIFQELPSNIEAGVRPSLTKDKLVKQLQDELNAVKENMRSIIEAQEASNEELQSANEEIISSNEELQSINHELETSKEEVESTNEELMTINTELQMRNEQLAEAYDYAEAVFTTIREGVLVLTNDLRVKSANRAFYRIFQVNENAVEGTLVYNLGNGQWNIPKLRELLEEVIPHNFEFNGFEVTHVFPFIGKKTMLLNARRILQKIHRQQLILLTIEDITEHREAQARLTEEKRRIQNIVNNAPVMLWMADPGKKMTFVNNAWLEFTGHELGQEIGLGWQEGIHADDMAIWRRTFDDAVANKRAFEVEYRFRRHDGIYRHVRNTGKPVILEDGSFTGFTGSCVEIAGQV